jgi:hypothetical protein
MAGVLSKKNSVKKYELLKSALKSLISKRPANRNHILVFWCYWPRRRRQVSLWTFESSKYYFTIILKDIKIRASRELAKIEAKQAKEYQELFIPTCPRINAAETFDLNAAIMNALSEKRVDCAVTAQKDEEHVDGEVYESTLNTKDGVLVKNRLGVGASLHHECRPA